MGSFAQISAIFFRWIDVVALTIKSLIDGIGPRRRRVELVEDDPDHFELRVTGRGRKPDLPNHAVHIIDGALTSPLPDAWASTVRGSRTEIILNPSRFLFQPLELPKRAAEFLDGIVRTQIDRLTPWSPNDAAFSWTPPTDIANDRIVVVVAATARAGVAPYAQAMLDLGAATVTLATTAPGGEPDAPRLDVYQHKASGVIDVPRIRQALIAVFLLTGLAAAASTAYSGFVSDGLETELQQLQHRIAVRRAALRTAPDGTVDSGQGTLARRKQTTPASVVILEALSGLLPDHTYVTELRIEGDKIQVVGVTHDAPSLIQLIEQSPYFTRATFFAPTTRSAEDPGERFHIEARIKPYLS